MELSGTMECSPYLTPSGILLPVKFKYNLEWEIKTMAKQAQAASGGTSGSAFDPDTFLNQEVTGQNEVKYTPVPIGEYQAYIDDLSMDSYEDQPILIVHYALLSEELKATLGLEKPTVQDRIFLDMNEDGSLAFGINKNVRLGRTREAVNQNDPKKKWNFNMLRGAGPVMIMVDHKFNKAGEGPFANVTRVARG